MPLADDVADSVAIFQMFQPETPRSSLRDLLPALERIDQRLERYDAIKGSRWKGQSIDTHLWHALTHLQKAATEFYDAKDFTRDLTAATLRCLMALTLLAKVQEGWVGEVQIDVAREK